MASNETFNAENLEVLGAKRLSELLFELSNWDNVLKQQLLMELACAQGPTEAVREISKGFEGMATSISYAKWNNADPLVRELDAHRDAIVRHVAPKKPREALALIWRFMGFAEDAILKCDDGFSIECVFHEACNDLGEIAKAAKLEPEELAQQVFDALRDNDYGQYDKLIPAIGPALGSEGLAHLKELIFEFRCGAVPVPDESVSEVSRIGAEETEDKRQSDYEREEEHRQGCFRNALLEIADVQGDLDAFIAEYESDEKKRPSVAIEIVRRLLAAGRAEEALEYIERADGIDRVFISEDWTKIHIKVLEALDRKDDAQAIRWSQFERNLDSYYLRKYLERLPEVERIEANERALACAEEHECLWRALNFFIDWRKLDHAARLIVDHHDEIEYFSSLYLESAADVFADSHPLAATLALRAMIDSTLQEGRWKGYGDAAKRFLACAELAPRINDFSPFETHDAYYARLKDRHGRKSSFWSRVDE